MTNIEIIKSCYEAFRRGDLPAIMERVSPKLHRFGVIGDGRRPAPWHIQVRSKAEVPRFFEALLGACEPVRFEPRDFVADGNLVYATIDQEYKVRSTGKRLAMRDVVHRFELRDGLVVDFSAQEDTALTAEALGPEDGNLELVRGLYDAFKRGDLPYIIERFGDLENSGVVADAKKKAPWHFPLAGKAVAKYFEALMGAMEPIRVEQRDLAAVGEYVYATVTQEWKVRASGKVLVMKDGAHRFRIRGGKVVEWRAFEDTALSGEALGL